MYFDIDIEKRIGGRLLRARIESDAGLTALFGPSGIGKTSVLNMVAGLWRPDRGRISVGGRLLFDSDAGVDISPQRRRAGYVFQDGRLFPHKNVRANLLYGHRAMGNNAGAMTLDDVIGFLDISHILDRYPRSLSGGEIQRVAIGRALLSAPQFLLMDEPLASLDYKRRGEVMNVIERLRDDLSLPILHVSHDRAELDRLAGQVVAMDVEGCSA